MVISKMVATWVEMNMVRDFTIHNICILQFRRIFVPTCDATASFYRTMETEPFPTMADSVLKVQNCVLQIF